jgi:hypothetical protein
MKLKKQDFSKKKNTKIVRAVLLVEKCTGLFSYQGNLYVAADHPVLEKKKQNKYSLKKAAQSQPLIVYICL